jgi:acyl-CoA thioester hydrolase
MFSYSHYKRVRYAETDKMGYLYYGHYAKYYEIGRVESMRSLGITYKSLEDDYKVMLPVLEMKTRYLRPAYYDENIEIRSILYEMPEKMILFHHELYNEEKKLINKASIKLFFIDMEQQKRISCPDVLYSKFSKFFD